MVLFWNSHTQNFENLLLYYSLQAATRQPPLQQFENFLKNLGKPKLLTLWASAKTDFNKNVREFSEIVWICQEK